MIFYTSFWDSPMENLSNTKIHNIDRDPLGSFTAIWYICYKNELFLHKFLKINL